MANAKKRRKRPKVSKSDRLVVRVHRRDELDLRRLARVLIDLALEDIAKEEAKTMTTPEVEDAEEGKAA